MKTNCVKEWKRVLEEEGEPNFWASIGASALLTAGITQKLIGAII